MVNINFRDPRPIYEQIRDGLRWQIVSGIMEPNERLPSVRELATRQQVNPNTIQRAYRELELEGYIYSVPGKGSFVGERREVDQERRGRLFKQFDESVSELLFLGVTCPELIERIREREAKK